MAQYLREDFERAWRIAEEAATQSSEEKDRFIAAACAGDEALLACVRDVMDSDTPDFLRTGGAQAVTPNTFGDYAANLLDTLGPGSIIGEYRLVRELGTGGMSRVYLARREGATFEQEVALKLMRSFSTAADNARRRFTREQGILANLSHPNIAGIVDGGVTPSNRPYIVMEYVDGASITEHCREQNLTLDERLGLFQTVCDAVGHAHRRLTVHRDIKPSNIMVNREGHPKLLDFGIAKLLDATQDADETQTGLRMMTPQYAAPEQVTGGQITTATDVFALGLVLFELLTDTPAREFSDLSHSERVARICADAPALQAAITARPGTAEPAVPWARVLRGDAEIIVAKALAPAPEDRYSGCDALVRDLQRWREGQPIEARAPSTAYIIRRFARRHVKAIAVGAILTAQALFSVGALISERAATREESARARDAEATTQAINRFLIDELLGATASGQAYGRDARVSDVLERATTTAGRAFADKPQLEARIRDTIGRTYLRMEKYDEAAEQLGQSLTFFESSLDEDHPDRLRSMASQAHLKAELGKLKKSREEIAHTLARQRDVLGPEHLDTLASQVLLGKIQTELDEWPQAEANLSGAIDLLNEYHLNQWRDRSEAMGALGELYISSRRYDDASAVLKARLALQRRYLGDRHPDKIETLTRDAQAMHHLRQTEAALKSSFSAVELAREVLGPKDPVLAAVLNNHGRLLLRNRRYEGAATIFESAIEIYSSEYGARHQRTLQSRNNLAAALAYQGRDAEAAEQYAKVIDDSIELFGERHTNTLRTMKNRTIALRTLGRDEEHRQLVARIVDIAKSYAGDESADPLIVSDMADYLLVCEPEDLRDPQLALTMARWATEQTERKRAQPLTNVGLALASLGQPDQAIAVYEEAALLPDGIKLFSLVREVAELYVRTGRLEDGAKFFEAHIQRVRDSTPPDHWTVGLAMHEYARFHVNAGQGNKALPIARDALAQLERSRAEDYALIARATAVMGAAKAQAGDDKNGEADLLRSFSTLKNDRHTTSDVKREIMGWLIALYEATGQTDRAQQWQAELDARQREPLWSLWR